MNQNHHHSTSGSPERGPKLSERLSEHSEGYKKAFFILSGSPEGATKHWKRASEVPESTKMEQKPLSERSDGWNQN